MFARRIVRFVVPTLPVTSLSTMRTEYGDSSTVLTDPTTFDRVICTPVVRMTRSQSMVFASMTVFAAVIVHGPLYAASFVPAGTPVLFGPGQPFGGGGTGWVGDFVPVDVDCPGAGAVGDPAPPVSLAEGFGCTVAHRRSAAALIARSRSISARWSAVRFGSADAASRTSVRSATCWRILLQALTGVGFASATGIPIAMAPKTMPNT